ncbi:hypothetical protein KO566_03920 [Flavobacteriaceae bacterium XHP0103]|uniref:hypothetical protein n=1 Tax=Marixanthotalea marina TaxID=2844359 RepID=UPI002989EF21|nr:hypothetical protein [Marixanthotalea marina]MBU3821197.1 hypothetical protein [Marixanthotalea marina]
MKLLKQLFDFYINSSIHVALSVFSLTWITLIEFKLPFDVALLWFVFFATITGYNFVKYFGVAKFHHRRLTSRLKAIQVFSFFSFLFLCYYALQLETKSLVFVALLGLVTFFYAIPFLPRHFFVDNQQNLRSISGLKVYLIALIWSGVTVFLPIVNDSVEIDSDIILTGIQRFVFIVVLMLPFEIRDLQYDNLKLGTIPQKIGITNTKIMGCVLLLCFVIMEFFKINPTTLFKEVTVLIAIIALLFLVFSKKIQWKYYSSFLVEGLTILWLVILMVVNYLG